MIHEAKVQAHDTRSQLARIAAMTVKGHFLKPPDDVEKSFTHEAQISLLEHVPHSQTLRMLLSALPSYLTASSPGRSLCEEGSRWSGVEASFRSCEAGVPGYSCEPWSDGWTGYRRWAALT